MDVVGLLSEAFRRLDEHVEEVCEGLPPAWLGRSVAPGTNHIGWLLWHQARQHDAQVAAAFGTPQVWDAGWAERFGTGAEPANMGYGHTPEQVAGVQPRDPQDCLDYQRAVNARTLELLARLDEQALDTVVDTNWDPHVTMGVRLVSVVDDAAQHCGQAKYLRGLFERG